MPIIDPTVALATRQEAFCRHYAVSGNAADAARQAGYSERSARQTGCALLERPRPGCLANVTVCVASRRSIRKERAEKRSGATVEAHDAAGGRLGRDPEGGAVGPAWCVKPLARCPASRCASFLPCRPDSTAQTMTLARHPGPIVERLRRIRLSWKRTERDEARILLARSEQAWDAAVASGSAYMMLRVLRFQAEIAGLVGSAGGSRARLWPLPHEDELGEVGAGESSGGRHRARAACRGRAQRARPGRTRARTTLRATEGT